MKIRRAVDLRSPRTGRRVLEGNSVGVGCTFHLEISFIRRIVTPNPGGKLRPPVLPSVYLTLPVEESKKCKN